MWYNLNEDSAPVGPFYGFTFADAVGSKNWNESFGYVIISYILITEIAIE